MTTSLTYRFRKLMLVIAGSCALIGLAAVSVETGTAGSDQGSTGSFEWPVKPFDRPHQIRGAFGDPRTVFRGPPTRDSLYKGAGTFSFHQGIDITAPDGTAVYPVASGTVTRVTKEWVSVDSHNGRSAEYWHITSKVRPGQYVLVGKTVLGRIKHGESHVHLTLLDHERVVNPAAPGRLAPCRDTTTPRIFSIWLRKSETSANEMPQFVRGSVYLLVEAADYSEDIPTPGLRVPSMYRNWPVAPARVTWRIARWDGKVVVPERVARDVRESVPKNDRFWSTFARGTYQGQSVFGPHYSYLQPGHYVFSLAGGRFDTRTLDDCVYDLVVTVQDSAGHRDVQSLRFTVHNSPGWAGKS